jgi:hypothetical protein
VETNLGDTLLVLAAEENGPGDPSRVLALEEKGLGFSVDEAEDLGITTDKDLALGGVDLATYNTAFRQIMWGSQRE